MTYRDLLMKYIGAKCEFHGENSGVTIIIDDEKKDRIVDVGDDYVVIESQGVYPFTVYPIANISLILPKWK